MITWFKIQPSKTKTFCLYHQKHKNLLSKSSKTSKPAVKTSKPSKPTVKIIKNIKTCCHLLYILQNKNHLSKSSKHQNLLSKHQNLLSKPSKPPVKIIKTSCQKHQNHLSKTSKPTVIITWLIKQEVPPIQEVPPTQEVPPYTGSPALYRKSRLHRKSRLIPEVPPLYRKPRPSINHFDRWCSILTTNIIFTVTFNKYNTFLLNNSINSIKKLTFYVFCISTYIWAFFFLWSYRNDQYLINTRGVAYRVTA